MTVPILNLNAQFSALRDELTSAVLSVLESGRFVLGPNVQDFERELSAYVNAKFAVALASGTDALHLALRAVGVGRGDLVVTSPFTFVATATDGSLLSWASSPPALPSGTLGTARAISRRPSAPPVRCSRCRCTPS